MCELQSRRGAERVELRREESVLGEVRLRTIRAWVEQDKRNGCWEFRGSIKNWLNDLLQRRKLIVGRLRIPNPIREALQLTGQKVYVTAGYDVWYIPTIDGAPWKLLYRHAS